MERSAKVLQFHESDRSVKCNGKTIRFKEQCWRVLALLVKNAPATVSRKEFINTIWAGNHETGDKGLNQALWTIRTELGDNARNPVFVRTVPRQGYQWIYPLTHWHEPNWPKFNGRSARVSSVALACSVALLFFGLRFSDVQPDALPYLSNAKDDSATSVRVDRDRIIVTMASGCEHTIIPDRSSLQLGSPVLSEDGLHVVFSARELDKCKIVSIAVRDGERRDFQGCFSKPNVG